MSDHHAHDHHDHPGHESLLDGGHRVTRRAAIGTAGAAGVAFMFTGLRGRVAGLAGLEPEVAEAATTCAMTPAKTEGPYFVDEKLERSDVRANTSNGAVQAGLPLTLKLQVFDADNDCAPVKGATVDIRHANADGLYSDEAANGTSGQNWLRGFQTTDANGLVTFKTVYPGWYTGRAVHIHFKVRVYDGSAATSEFTSQMFFTDEMNTKVFSTYSPYKDRSRPSPDTTDSSDFILGSDAATLTLNPVSDGNGGLTADFSVGLSQQTSQNSTSGMSPQAPSSTTSTTSGDKTLSAVLKQTRVVTTTTGRRQVRLKVNASETVAATATLTRSGKTLGRKVVALTSGTKYVRVSVPSATRAGAVKVKLVLQDAQGNKKTYTRTVHVKATSG